MIAVVRARPPDSVFTVERLIYPLINEAVLALQEHIASVSDIDMAMIAGTGMTYHGERKGPLAIADEIGLDVVLAGLEEFFAAVRRALPAGPAAAHEGPRRPPGRQGGPRVPRVRVGDAGLGTLDRGDPSPDLRSPPHSERSYAWQSTPTSRSPSKTASPS